MNKNCSFAEHISWMIFFNKLPTHLYIFDSNLYVWLKDNKDVLLLSIRCFNTYIYIRTYIKFFCQIKKWQHKSSRIPPWIPQRCLAGRCAAFDCADCRVCLVFTTASLPRSLLRSSPGRLAPSLSAWLVEWLVVWPAVWRRRRDIRCGWVQLQLTDWQHARIH